MALRATKYQQLIEEKISKHTFGKSPLSLYEPIQYIMALGGKRLRPVLTLLGYSLYKDDAKNIANQALAIEVFHNFTLMHDDIMDDAPLRRGQATVHEKWNRNTAVLSGDVMLVKAYDLLLDSPEHLLNDVFKIFNKCAAQVCEGQQFDMEFETREKVTEAEYLEMIRLKTAVLLGMSLQLGALLAEADKDNQKALYNFGVNIGIGFQLMDDLLDVYADKSKFGKQVGGDIIANKKTFLLIEALERANKKQLSELNKWLTIKKFDADEKVAAVTKIYNELNIKAITEEKINFYYDKGFASLKKVNGSIFGKSQLKQFAEALMARQR